MISRAILTLSYYKHTDLKFVYNCKKKGGGHLPFSCK